MSSPLDTYLQQLKHELRHDPLLARRVVDEAADHLAQIVAAERRQGMSQQDAEQEAVRRFGAPGPLARQFEGFSMPLKAMLALASLATLLVAAWLVSVIAFVLPRHDPDRIPLWTGVVVGYLIYSGLSIAYLVLGARVRALRAVVVALSLVAIALGIWAVAQMVRASASGGHFEGYLMLMGLILAGHGLIALANTLVSFLIAGRLGVTCSR